MEYNWREEKNLSMLTDFYELTMSNGYFQNRMKDKIAVFDMFFRRIPDEGGFAIPMSENGWLSETFLLDLGCKSAGRSFSWR